MAMKSVALSLPNSCATMVPPSALHAAREHLGGALAVGGAVVDHRDLLGLQVFHREVGDGHAHVVVARQDAKDVVVALPGEGRVGGGRHVGQARAAVDGRGRNGGARIEVAQHALHAHVGQLVGHHHRLLGVGLVVFGLQHELDLLAADDEALLVEVFDREPRAVVVVLAPVGGAAGERAGVADGDGLLGLR
jgi:hypothetical protein